MWVCVCWGVWKQDCELVLERTCVCICTVGLSSVNAIIKTEREGEGKESKETSKQSASVYVCRDGAGHQGRSGWLLGVFNTPHPTHLGRVPGYVDCWVWACGGGHLYWNQALIPETCRLTWKERWPGVREKCRSDCQKESDYFFKWDNRVGKRVFLALLFQVVKLELQERVRVFYRSATPLPLLFTSSPTFALSLFEFIFQVFYLLQGCYFSGLPIDLFFCFFSFTVFCRLNTLCRQCFISVKCRQKKNPEKCLTLKKDKKTPNWFYAAIANS